MPRTFSMGPPRGREDISQRTRGRHPDRVGINAGRGKEGQNAETQRAQRRSETEKRKRDSAPRIIRSGKKEGRSKLGPYSCAGITVWAWRLLVFGALRSREGRCRFGGARRWGGRDACRHLLWP